MTPLPSWMPLDVVRDLGWTLVHFLWLGLIPAVLLEIILPMCRSAAVRHNAVLATLAVLAATPIATFLLIHSGGVSGTVSPETFGMAVGSLQFAANMPAVLARPYPGIEWLAVLWIAGVAVLSLRMAGGWWLAEGLRRRETLSLPADLLLRCHALQQRIALARPVRFALSQRVHVPMVVGWLRPVVLFPVAVATGIPPHQLDALILHELAHIRRLDAFTNLFVMTVETLLFYHPAVWWLGARIRAERENCCDDLAVAACGDAAIYAEALTSLEMHKAAYPPALAANGGTLKTRVARLFDRSLGPKGFSLGALAGATLLCLVVLGIAVMHMGDLRASNTLALRLAVDDAKNARGADKMPAIVGRRGTLMVKRGGGITREQFADARKAIGPQGKPIIEFTLNDKGRARLATLTRENISHQLAFVVDGVVVGAPYVSGEVVGGKGIIDGGFTDAGADALVDKIMRAIYPGYTTPPVAPLVQEKQQVKLTIEADGTVTWNGVALAGEQQLIEKIKGAAATSPEPKFDIEAAQEAPYAQIQRFMQLSYRYGLQGFGIMHVRFRGMPQPQKIFYDLLRDEKFFVEPPPPHPRRTFYDLPSIKASLQSGRISATIRLELASEADIPEIESTLPSLMATFEDYFRSGPTYEVLGELEDVQWCRDLLIRARAIVRPERIKTVSFAGMMFLN